MKRILDIIISFFLLLSLFPLLLLVIFAVKISSPGSVIYWSKRIGKNNKIFHMPKFRTMQIETPIVATHLLINSEKYLTPIGTFLRKTSIDELPQLWSILIGNMSLVGPRPALFNQHDLIFLRAKYNVNSIKPGLTGLAQINGRDEISIEEKIKFDCEYLDKISLKFDILILLETLIIIFRTSKISH